MATKKKASKTATTKPNMTAFVAVDKRPADLIDTGILGIIEDIQVYEYLANLTLEDLMFAIEQDGEDPVMDVYEVTAKKVGTTVPAKRVLYKCP
jgi:hypothetical protein